MKAITIQQPWASLIVQGIKDIENRTWPTKFRGRVLVHASAKPIKIINPKDAFTYNQWESFSLNEKVQLMSKGTSFLPMSNSTIIGSVEIVDCVINHESIWAEKTEIPAGCYMGEKPIYNWVLANPILFPEPIPAKGKLSFWDYPGILAEPEEKSGHQFCHCQIPVKEENQVRRLFGHDECRYCSGIWYK